jgi:hypothetical protein
MPAMHGAAWQRGAVFCSAFLCVEHRFAPFCGFSSPLLRVPPPAPASPASCLVARAARANFPPWGSLINKVRKARNFGGRGRPPLDALDGLRALATWVGA